MDADAPGRSGNGAGAAAAPAGAPLPRPVKGRWRPLRCGLLNLYRYDEEELWFEQGRLLLRGNNGTGKSRILALTLPFLLDGEIAPHRVEPDRDPAKRMEWNLLMNRHPDRLGYTWLELGRLLDDGTEAFLTLGCGLRAVQGRGIADRWYFLTPKRVGRDLFLTTETRAPLGRERLEEVVGREGVHRQAREYRRAVDDALFRLGPRYESLIELLIRLRQPQLSRQLDERALSRALSDALPPLPASLVEDTAEAFRGLEVDREDLAGVRETRAAVERFLEVYRRYVRTAARRRAEAVRTAHSAYEGAARRAREATGRRDEANEARRRVLDELDANERATTDYAAEVRALEESPEMRQARELEGVREEAERREREHARAEKDAAAAIEGARSAEAEHADLAAAVEGVSRDVREALAGAARKAAAAGFADAHAAAIGMPEALVTAPDRADSARHALDRSMEQRERAIALLRERNAELARALRRSEEADRLARAAADELAGSREREQAARRALGERAEGHFRSFRAWRNGVAHLAVADADSLAEAFDAWVADGEGESPLRAAAEAARREAERVAVDERARLETEGRDVDDRIAALDEEIDRLERGVHAPPPAPHTRATPRDGRPGAPLWHLCDFRAGVSASDRAGLEAALEASGLLDAWVEPEGSLVDAATEDTILVAGARDVVAAPSSSLARWLEPASPGDQAAVPEETVRRVLAAIGSGPDTGEHWAAIDGRWRMGPLHGRWSKREAEHIGEASREAARRRQLDVLRRERGELARARERLDAALRDVGSRLSAIARELSSLPSEEPVREARSWLAHAADEVTRRLEGLHEAEDVAGRARTDRDEARVRRDADAADLGLVEWVDALDELRDAFGRYREALSGVWPEIRRFADLDAQRAKAAARLEMAVADRDERERRWREAARDARAARSRSATLEETVGATVQAVVARLDAARHRLATVREARAGLETAEREHDRARVRAEADIERHSADRARHESERGAAIDRLASFARAELLAEADPAFAGLDTTEEWTPTRGVEVARHAETRLADTSADDESWRRRQESVHQHVSTLRDQLVPRGHRPEEHFLEDGVVAVRCPFQGRLRSMSDLEATLAEDLTARTRLLDEKEREVIENHLLGEVVLELQRLVLDAERWVGATNDELTRRPTSTGMLLRFRWEADAEGPEGVDSVRTLLLRTRELWTPEERRGLAEFLQARIREIRERDETGSWRDLLADALDYRRWHSFAVERHQDGQWRRLTRRTYGTGSGGEKALALTLPQFAAAAAHYRSADPAAPRLILLDEVFVGIDSDMRAKCMGLLETFDLDFVMTSEREWGCYPTLPGLAIYQLSSRPGIDAVVCTRWVWNGHELRRDATETRANERSAEAEHRGEGRDAPGAVVEDTTRELF